jgi:DNA-binding transcriptional MerR regulator
MKGHETGLKTTIKSAAKHLAVSTKTVQRYLARGILTKIKQGTRTYLLMSEVEELNRDLGMRQRTEDRGQRADSLARRARDTVTVDRERYELMLIELGELRRQSMLIDEYRSSLQLNAEAFQGLKQHVERLDARLTALESARNEEDAAKPVKSKIRGSEEASKPAQKPWWQK